MTEAVDFLHTKNIRIQDIFSISIFYFDRTVLKTYFEVGNNLAMVRGDPRPRVSAAYYQRMETTNNRPLLRWNKLRRRSANVHIRVEGQLR